MKVVIMDGGKVTRISVVASDIPKSMIKFLGISTRRNSKNVLYAAITTRAKGMKVFGLMGEENSKLEQMSDV